MPVIECLNYDLSFQFPGSIQDVAGAHRVGDIQAVAAPGGMGDQDVLIGLDVLAEFTLTANWRQAWFELSPSLPTA